MPQFSLEQHYPFTSRYFTIDGVRMHYIDEGAGPVVVMLHGNPTWGFFFRNLIADLRTSFRVIVPDHIGCGLSDHPEDRHYRAADRSEHVRQLLEACGVNKFSLVMHDWGGPIGTLLALQNPERIERMVYFNTTLTETESLPWIIRRAVLPIMGPWLTKRTRHFVKLATDFGVVKKLSPEVRAGYHYPYQTSAQRTAIWDFVADIPFDNQHPSYTSMLEMGAKLPALRHVPVKIIWGLKDPCFHVKMMRHVMQLYPHAEVLELPNAGHLVIEDGGPEILTAVRSFLTTSTRAEMEAKADAFEKKNRPSDAPLIKGFWENVARRPQADAVVVPSFGWDALRYEHVSFRELGDLVRRYERGLSEQGLKAGDRVLMLVTPGIEFLALSYAVMGRGAAPVFIDPGIGKENLFQCISDARPDFFIGVPKAQILSRIRKDLFKTVRGTVIAARWWPFRGTHLGLLKRFSAVPLAPAPVNEVGFIAFTSGGTGVPKGVFFSQRMLGAQLEIFKNIFGLTTGKKDLPLLPIFSLFHLANGLTSVFFPMQAGKPLELNPADVVRVIEDLGIETSFGSPTLWNKIAEYCVRVQTKLPSLKTVLMAGAPVSKQTLERVQSVLVDGTAYTPYGATEALPVTFISSAELEAAPGFKALEGEVGTLVGRPVDGVELKVIGAVDGPIKSAEEMVPCLVGQIGEVVVTGANVSVAYLNRTDADLKSKIRDGDRVWHRLGDMGYVDSAGQLYFCGRQAHVVHARGRAEPYYSIPTERVFNEHPKVRRTALVSLGQGSGVGIVIEPMPEYFPTHQAEREAFVVELLRTVDNQSVAVGIVDFFFHHSFPVDARHNAKIFRDKLGAWASEQMREGSEVWVRVAAESGAEKSTAFGVTPHSKKKYSVG